MTYTHNIHIASYNKIVTSMYLTLFVWKDIAELCRLINSFCFSFQNAYRSFFDEKLEERLSDQIAGFITSIFD